MMSAKARIARRGGAVPAKTDNPKFDQELFEHIEANGLDYDELDPRFSPFLETGSPDTDRREAEVARLIRMYGLGRAGHAHFSPSSSAGWLNCRGFLLANAGKPDMAGVDAAYGTVAHGIAATWLTAIRDEGRKVAEHVPQRFLGFKTMQDGYEIVCDADMIRHIRTYIDWCRTVEIEGRVFIEQRVDYSIYTPIPSQGGTADHFVCVDGGDEGGHLIITDLKMGMGIWVDVVRNTQAMLYALGVFLEWDWFYNFQTITIRICQPRLDYFGVWQTTREDLLAFGEEVRVKATQAWVENAPRSPSPKACQWCADKSCVARSALLEDLADDMFDDDDVIEGEIVKEYSTEALDNHALSPLFGPIPKDKEPKFHKGMSVALMAWRYSHRKMFEAYFREIGEELLQIAQSGTDVPGWKIANGRRRFKWQDEEDAAAELERMGLTEKEIFKVKTASVAAARKLLLAKGVAAKEIELLFSGAPPKKVGRKTMAGTPGLVKTLEGKPTLVHATDPRDDVQDDADDSFDDDDEL